MADLFLKVGDRLVPLLDCCWVAERPCGCPYAVLVAGPTWPTEDAAWAQFHPTAPARQAAKAEGRRVRAAVLAEVKADDGFWQRMKGCRCEQGVSTDG